MSYPITTNGLKNEPNNNANKTANNNTMHAKPDLRVILQWMIAGSGSVIASRYSPRMIPKRTIRRPWQLPDGHPERHAIELLQPTRSTFYLNRHGRVWDISTNADFDDASTQYLFEFGHLIRFRHGMVKPTRSVHDVTIEKLVKHPKICCIMLERCINIGDGAVRAIAENKWIRWVHLNCPGVTDNGIKFLDGTNHLVRLALCYSNVTERSVDYLIGMDRLRYLFLGDCEFSPTAIETLRAALPKCQVWRWKIGE